MKDPEVLDRAECLRLLATARYGRVVYTVRGLPAVQPVRFVVRDDAVSFLAAEHSDLLATADGGVVAFEADEWDDEKCWWVTVLGRAAVVPAPAGLPSLHVPAAGIRVPAEVVTGRRAEGRDPA